MQNIDRLIIPTKAVKLPNDKISISFITFTEITLFRARFFSLLLLKGKYFYWKWLVTCVGLLYTRVLDTKWKRLNISNLYMPANVISTNFFSSLPPLDSLINSSRNPSSCHYLKYIRSKALKLEATLIKPFPYSHPSNKNLSLTIPLDIEPTTLCHVVCR